MQIDRSNYEIWVIDWLDGKLDEVQRGRLIQFFAENPDLKEESEDLGILKIQPSEKGYGKKKTLIKSPANITESQFGFLCAAYLENDLSAEQIKELKEAIAADTERARSFELFMKMKLVPLNVTYNGKNRLKRKTLPQKAIRLSLIGLSAAAIITFAVLTFVSRQQPPLTTGSQKIAVAASQNKITTATPLAGLSESDKKISGTGKSASKPGKKVAHDEKAIVNQDVNEVSQAEHQPVVIEKVQVSQKIELESELPSGKLIACNIAPVPEEIIQESARSKVGKFFVKTFREKILREEVPVDTPIKAFEIAEAGVSGLNKILGWQMALDEKTDESGNPKSVYFSSKILKFNAPVKKSEALP
jgi:hypothetical protein